ncbi:MAG TPA: hypothetical protein VFZ11_12550 [Gemmatimonadaceae bacterium]
MSSAIAGGGAPPSAFTPDHPGDEREERDAERRAPHRMRARLSEQRLSGRREAAGIAGVGRGRRAGPCRDRLVRGRRPDEASRPDRLERRRHLPRRPEPVRRRRLERLHDHRLERRRRRRTIDAQRTRPVHEPLREHGLGRRADERGDPREHLVEHAAEREEVAASVVVALPHRLLGAHVGDGSAHDALRRRDLVERPLDRTRDPEVREACPCLAEEDVLRLHIAVDDAVPVRVVERPGERARDRDRVGHRELPLAQQALAKRAALHERHRVEEHPARLARVQQPHDARMVEVPHARDLPEEPVGAEILRQRRIEDLEGDGPPAPLVVGQPDGRGAPLPDLALDRVAAGEGGRDRGRWRRAPRQARGGRIDGHRVGRARRVGVLDARCESALRERPSSHVPTSPRRVECARRTRAASLRRRRNRTGALERACRASGRCGVARPSRVRCRPSYGPPRSAARRPAASGA